MLITVQGTYENGAIRLDELVSPTLTGRVLVTFLPEAAAPVATLPTQPRFSFDEALALTAESSDTRVADAVIAEREEYL